MNGVQSYWIFLQVNNENYRSKRIIIHKTPSFTANPSCAEDQLQHCIKLYRYLSEIKGEIEIVIKSGRKVCEDASTKNPRKLNQRIDALKHLYNNLGETVTDSKKQLEFLCKLTKELNSNFALIDNYLTKRRNQDLSQDPEQVIKDDDESEINAVRIALDKCNKLFQEYAEVCDLNYLGDLKDRIEILTSRFEQTIRRREEDIDDLKLLCEMRSSLQNMNNISVATLK